MEARWKPIWGIDCWDDRAARWMGCFNGRTIGADFIATIISRTMRKARLFIVSTAGGNPAIAEFAAYNDVTGGPSNR